MIKNLSKYFDTLTSLLGTRVQLLEFRLQIEELKRSCMNPVNKSADDVDAAAIFPHFINFLEKMKSSKVLEQVEVNRLLPNIRPYLLAAIEVLEEALGLPNTTNNTGNASGRMDELFDRVVHLLRRFETEIRKLGSDYVRSGENLFKFK